MAARRGMNPLLLFAMLGAGCASGATRPCECDLAYLHEGTYAFRICYPGDSCDNPERQAIYRNGTLVLANDALNYLFLGERIGRQLGLEGVSVTGAPNGCIIVTTYDRMGGIAQFTRVHGVHWSAYSRNLLEVSTPYGRLILSRNSHRLTGGAAAPVDPNDARVTQPYTLVAELLGPPRLDDCVIAATKVDSLGNVRAN